MLNVENDLYQLFDPFKVAQHLYNLIDPDMDTHVPESVTPTIQT